MDPPPLKKNKKNPKNLQVRIPSVTPEGWVFLHPSSPWEPDFSCFNPLPTVAEAEKPVQSINA